jgi:hypothetical protein
VQNTFIWELVRNFSRAEVKEVEKFLASPFFNHREDVRALFEVLSNKSSPPDKEAAWAKVFPGAAFDDQQFRLITSYLLKLLEEYLYLKEQRPGETSALPRLLSAYRRRKLPGLFEKTQKAIAKQIDNQSLKNPEWHFEQYRLAHEQYLYLLESGRTKDLNLQTVETQLTAAMIAMKLRQACLLRAHQAVFNVSYRIDLLESILDLAGQPPYVEMPAVSVYRHCYLALFGSENEAQFGEFKAQLFQHGDKFPKAEIGSLYLLAINFCIKKINANQQRYRREALDLYKEGLKTDLLLENGQLTRFSYNNIIGIALRLEDEWTWAEEFLHRYKDLLDPSHRQATFSLNAARLDFVRKRYDEALLHLQLADYKDFINSMVAKTLQLKIYYEKGEWELLDAHLRTVRMYIRRNKRMGYHYKNWQNVLHFTQKLAELNPFDEVQRAALKSAIEQEEILTEKEWLLEQL